MNEEKPTLKHTPLTEEHRKLKAKLIDFGGWLMPVSYEGVLAEHKCVREKVGIFDVSHMGEVRVKGEDAENFLQYLTVNDVNRLAVGKSHYSAMLNEQGGFIDDLIIYRLGEFDFLLCVNASNTEKDFKWIREVSEDFNVSVENASEHFAQIAIQGPSSKAAMEMILTGDERESLGAMKFGHFFGAKILGESTLVARTGYTGEHGYELYLPAKAAPQLWTKLLSLKDKTGLSPIGLGARDTLRLEACYLLYGNDMDDTINPFEAGISWAVKMDCGEFIGKGALDEQNVKGLKRLLMAFKMTEQGIPRHGMEIYSGDELVGKVTSGSVLPSVGGAGGMALVDVEKVRIGDELRVDVRGKTRLARVVKKPLYQAKTKS